jgi:4-amino-4-deoxy-L-arabinose transferase-like glycosyltransferase
MINLAAAQQNRPGEFDLKKDAQALLSLYVFSTLLFFVTPFYRDLWSPDEPRYAAIAKEMVLTGNWVTPHLNGTLYTEKPPLHFWLMALSACIFGSYSNAVLIFPSFLAAFGCLAVTYFLGKSLFNRRVGFLSVMVLATSSLFLGLAQFIRMDVTLTFLMTCSLYCFLRGHQRARGKTVCYVTFYILLAFAFLTKGPIGIFLPSIVVILYLALKRDFKAAREAKPLAGILLMSLIVCTWMALAVHKSGWEYLQALLIRGNLERAFNSWEHDRPFYYYLILFPTTFFPWFPFLIGAVFYHDLLKRFREVEDNILLLAMWFGAIFIFFSLMSAKEGLYMLPLLPPASLLVGEFWHKALAAQSGDSRLHRYFSFSAYSLCVVYLIAAIAALCGVMHKVIDLPNELATIILTGAVTVAVISQKLNRPKAIFITILASMIFLLAYSVWFLIPSMNTRASLSPLGNKLALHSKNGESIGMYNCDRPSCYFYTDSYITMLGSKEDAVCFLASRYSVLCVVRQTDADDILKRLKDPYLLEAVEVGGAKLVLISRPSQNRE